MLFVQKLFPVRKGSQSVFSFEEIEKSAFGVKTRFKRYLRNAFIRVFKQQRCSGKPTVGNYGTERFSVVFYYYTRCLLFA